MSLFKTTDLRTPLTLMIPSLQQDGEGGYSKVWALGPIIWACLSPVRHRLSPDVVALPALQYRVVVRSIPSDSERIQFAWERAGRRTYLFARTTPIPIQNNRFFEIIMEETRHEQNCP